MQTAVDDFTNLNVVQLRGQPSELLFFWGSNTQLADRKFYLEKVNVKYTMFGRTGNPLRATADITLRPIEIQKAGA